MYCNNCRCEYVGWKGKCPQCRNYLIDEPPPVIKQRGEQLTYEALVETIENCEGNLSIELNCIEVFKERKWSFPYFGYGYAWTKSMQGSYQNLIAHLNTTEVGRSKKNRFPYLGYGFAWEARMEGDIAGNPLTLKSSKVNRDTKIRFPYKGFGFAWTQEMNGNCGEQIQLSFQTTEVMRRMGWRFPYFGFGYAWISKGVLSLTILERTSSEVANFQYA